MAEETDSDSGGRVRAGPRVFGSTRAGFGAAGSPAWSNLKGARARRVCPGRARDVDSAAPGGVGAGIARGKALGLPRAWRAEEKVGPPSRPPRAQVPKPPHPAAVAAIRTLYTHLHFIISVQRKSYYLIII